MSRWPLVPLSEVMRHVSDPCAVSADTAYPNFGIYSFGRGLFPKPPISGAATSARTLYRVRRGQFIYSRLFAFEGAYGLVGDEYDRHFVSNEYPTFECDPSRLDVHYLTCYFQCPNTWEEVASLTTGIGHRRQRIQPDKLLSHCMPLPPLADQRRVTEKVNALQNRIDAAQTVTREAEAMCGDFLLAAFKELVKNAPRRRLGEIAPLHRRPAAIDISGEYPQVSVRSFGRGTFHKPPLQGSDITWEKPHLVKAGDILISNIKAWEGAIAVARPEDDGRYGSHRYLTYVPVPGVTTARFICFFLLSPAGLHHVGEASPGSADRNRTTSAKALLGIPVPLPNYEAQRWFGVLYDKVDDIKKIEAQTTGAREVLVTAIME